MFVFAPFFWGGGVGVGVGGVSCRTLVLWYVSFNGILSSLVTSILRKRKLVERTNSFRVYGLFGSKL